MSHSSSRTLSCAWLRDARVATALIRHGAAACAAWIGLFAASTAADGDPWLEIQVIRHADFQAVNPDGTPAYAGGFPVRLVGVVVNHTEDWLDPTPAFAPGPPFFMGGQAEFFVQAVDLDGTPWDPFPDLPYDDFGGTACWVGQNYGNLPFVGDPDGSYTDVEWTAELGRLGLFGGDGVTEPLRAGDLVELRARGGLFFQGKMNVNEQHSKSASRDFEVVVLKRGFGLLSPPLLLADLKTEADEFVFDADRQTGGEYFQGSRVRLLSVRVTEEVSWTAGAVFAVSDGMRSMNLRLGRHPGFDGGTVFPPGTPFDVTGILNQASATGTDGYQVLVMKSADCAASPAGLALEILAGRAVVRWPANPGVQVLLRSASMTPESWLPAPGEPVASSGMQVHREPVEAGRIFFKLGEP
jgi:hypothetical protein